MITDCSDACDHEYRRLYISIFLPLWLGVATVCTAAVLSMGWTAALTAFMVTCSMYPAGSVYEYLLDRLLNSRRCNIEPNWIVRFSLYIAVVPLFPMTMFYILHMLGMAGLEYALQQQGAWSAGCSLSLAFGYFRLRQMPMSIQRILEPVWHNRSSV